MLFLCLIHDTSGMLFEGKVSPCRLLKISAEVGLDQRRVLRLLCKEWSMDLETFMVVLQDGEEQGEMNGSRLKDTASDELQGILYSPIDRKQLRKTLQHCRVSYQEALANMKESDAHLIAMRMLPSIVDDIMLLREEVGVYPGVKKGFQQACTRSDVVGNSTESPRGNNLQEHEEPGRGSMDEFQSEGQVSRHNGLPTTPTSPGDADESMEHGSSSSDDSEADMSGIDFSRRESSFSHGFTDYDQEEVGCSSDGKQGPEASDETRMLLDQIKREAEESLRAYRAAIARTSQGI
mmetsp:Transcript_18732/g.61518  ORF Transcript_18732/g.61518 Transcript_18732/m.61518 type:complete len:293 (-) Transcript_18732:292-1170(-)